MSDSKIPQNKPQVPQQSTTSAAKPSPNDRGPISTQIRIQIGELIRTFEQLAFANKEPLLTHKEFALRRSFQNKTMDTYIPFTGQPKERAVLQKWGHEAQEALLKYKEAQSAQSGNIAPAA